MIAMAAVSPFHSNESVSLPQLQNESVDGNEDPPSSSVDFGNLETLSHIRSLTDVGAMTRLLHECIAYQRGLDLRLESLLAQRPDLDRHLFSIQRCSHLLDIARSDSGILLDSVRSTANLADQVSRKVRELDLAQSRVESTLSRIDAIVESSHCLDGARRAIDSDDYDSAARFIHTFLQIDARFRDSGSNQREQLLECKRKLESVVRSRLSAAIDKRDHHTILRFIHVFPPLGLQEEGLQIYVSYLRKVISLRSRLEFEHLMEIAEKGDHLASSLGQGGANFVTCLTNLFKDIVLAVEDNDEVLRSLCGEDGIVYSICELQEECDSRGTQILKKYLDYRKLSRLASEINTYSKNLLSAGSTEGPDPREVEIYLEEILSLMQLGEDYTEFMVSKIRGLGFVDPELGPRATKAFRSGNFNRGVQDLTGFYVILEEFFMVENVRKAITIDEHVTDSLTTSMVDDVFFVLQSCCRRAISSGSSNSILALLSGAINLLTNEYQDALQQKLREPNIGAKLFLGGVGVQKTGIDIATALNNVDVSAEYVLKLRHEIEEQCAEALPSAGEREKMKSCVSELGEISEGLRRIQRSGMEQLMGSISGRIRPALDSVAGISYELSDAEYEENEVNDPWVGKLIQAVEVSTGWLQPAMTVGNYDSLLHSVIDFTVRRLDAILMQKRFSQLGGLQLDREVRALVTHFSDLSQRPVRDKFARLSQIATLLNFERVSEILDFWGENAAHMTWLLTPADVRRVLSLRIDFTPEAISALRL